MMTWGKGTGGAVRCRTGAAPVRGLTVGRLGARLFSSAACRRDAPPVPPEVLFKTLGLRSAEAFRPARGRRRTAGGRLPLSAGADARRGRCPRAGRSRRTRAGRGGRGRDGARRLLPGAAALLALALRREVYADQALDLVQEQGHDHALRRARKLLDDALADGRKLVRQPVVSLRLLEALEQARPLLFLLGLARPRGGSGGVLWRGRGLVAAAVGRARGGTRAALAREHLLALVLRVAAGGGGAAVAGRRVVLAEDGRGCAVGR